MMRTALVWTVNDLPTYGMVSGWSTAKFMGCPVCMDDTRVFHLQHGRKRATLTTTNSLSLGTIHTEGIRNSSRRIMSRIRLHVRD
ncbi:UNVERIFIED_CONTAM: hypothetical protein Sangu_2550200 [Sesamum angustifolium]|uniref:Secreted protein n=1 Tax=Sesamum angustifolium TaxID=2727405 RepID=A0AAW2J9S2_9LAMI